MSATKNLNNRFMQEMFMDSLNVPCMLLREYEQIGITEQELVLLLRLLLLYYKKGNFTLNMTATEFSITEDEAAGLINPLVAKDILICLGEGREEYTLDGLFVQLYELWVLDKRRSQKNATQRTRRAETQKRQLAEVGQLYRVFEREMGRSLSPIENEKISQWLEVDKQSPELILEALRRSVLHGKTTFAYIDKILLNWRRQNLRTSADIELHTEEASKKPAKKTAGERVKDTWL
ncbi:MAG: DnaD domain protein [Firmicutes bacterium]|nr:DnaD domain protein [Bacillota bacterium]